MEAFHFGSSGKKFPSSNGFRDGISRGRVGISRGRVGISRGRVGNYRGSNGNYRGSNGNSRGSNGNYRGRGGNYRGRGWHPKPFVNSPTAEFLPGSDVRPEEVFTFPYIMDDDTVEYITNNKKIMFIIRGPSGTGKTTLSAMLNKTYPAAVVCSADSYFDTAFVNKFRSRETLKESHDFCQKRVRQECEKETHPIIVQNTHMRKWEMQAYMDLAKEYGYNVIMAVTLRKFKVDPEILAHSNKKGLTAEYFEVRLSQWEEYFPLYTGWFLGQDDSSFILNEVKKCLGHLLGDSKFCNAMSAYSEEEIWGQYLADQPLFCIAAFTDNGKTWRQKDYYLSKIVQENYGKRFQMKILGMVVRKTEIFLVIGLTDDMKKVQMIFNDSKGIMGASSDDNDDVLSGAMSQLRVGDEEPVRATTTTLKEKFSTSGSTSEPEDWEDEEPIDVKNIGFMRVARAKGVKYCIRSVEKLISSIFSSVVDSSSLIEETCYREFNDDTKYCRLPDETWFIRMPMKISIDSFFGALYV